jgi:predicted DNA-binding transcriptional regulator AlpA
MLHTNPDPLLIAEDAAAEVGLSIPAFWRAVSSGRLPSPLYPAPRAPRWRRSELHAALEATRALPAEAKAARRAAKIARAA